MNYMSPPDCPRRRPGRCKITYTFRVTARALEFRIWTVTVAGVRGRCHGRCAYDDVRPEPDARGNHAMYLTQGGRYFVQKRPFRAAGPRP